MKHIKCFFIFCNICFFCGVVFSQPAKISGLITDAKSGMPVPFAAISLKHFHIGTNSNQEGMFDLYFPKEAYSDSCVVSCLGYISATFAIDTIKGNINISILPSVLQLSEVIIRPLLPTDYIRMAMRSLKENYPLNPFQSQSYYREQVNENNVLINQTEGIFKTYYPDYQDTIKNQHQLLLFRKADAKQIAFMREYGEHKKEKKLKKAIRKGEDTTKIKETDFVSIKFGGPETIISMDFIKEKEPFLDSNQFKKFSYAFAGSSTYQGKELMVISFDGLKHIDNLLTKGRIYIDVNSMAITTITYTASFELPFLIRPVLFLYGLSIENAIFEKRLQYQEINGRWFPKDFNWIGKGSITKKHWFSANEHSDFTIEQLLFVNKVETSGISPVDPKKKFNAGKKPEEQVYNDIGISWSDVNKIQ